MVEGRLVDLMVDKVLIQNVIMTEKGALYTKYGDRGKPAKREIPDQVKTKTLLRLLVLLEIFLEERLNPQNMSPSLITDIVQALMKCNRHTAMDYAKTLFYIFGRLGDFAPHSPRIVEKPTKKVEAF